MLLGTLGDVMDLVPVHSRADAFQALKHDPEGIDLIISTIAFDESQMVEFLQAVKRDADLSRIPFLCSRVLPGVPVISTAIELPPTASTTASAGRCVAGTHASSAMATSRASPVKSWWNSRYLKIQPRHMGSGYCA